MAEDGRPVLRLVGADALEDAGAVVEAVAEYVDLGVVPSDELAIHPDRFSLLHDFLLSVFGGAIIADGPSFVRGSERGDHGSGHLGRADLPFAGGPGEQVSGAEAAGERAFDGGLDPSAAAPSSRPWRSIIATERKVASGLAASWPAMSGADPCTGSNTPGPSSPRLAEGSIPSEPVIIADSSLRMSPNMFSVTITSKCGGVGDELHRGVVDEQVVEGDFRVFAGESRDHLAPQA